MTRRASLKLPLRWVAAIGASEATLAAGSAVNNIILQSSDYEQQSSMEPSGVTLMRIRGQISLRSTLAGAVFTMGIQRFDPTSVPPVPTSVNYQRSGNLLWMFSTMVPLDTNRLVEVDIRSKRRLEGHTLFFSAIANGAAVTYHSNFRLLVRGG